LSGQKIGDYLGSFAHTLVGEDIILPLNKGISENRIPIVSRETKREPVDSETDLSAR
jgi:hypothetical protein